jgi:hypothetical protein
VTNTFSKNSPYVGETIFLEKNTCDLDAGGMSYEPPLTNVFTMQWFLTLFSTCLPRETVLRVWDLIFLVPLLSNSISAEKFSNKFYTNTIDKILRYIADKIIWQLWTLFLVLRL